MTADSQLAVQTAVLAALRGHSALTSLLANGADSVVDHVEQGTSYPYVAIGETTAQAFDAKTDDGMEQTLTIHCWSRHLGMREVKEIMGEVVEAVDRSNMSLTGHALVLLRFEFSETLLDPDGITRHGVQRLRAITQAV